MVVKSSFRDNSGFLFFRDGVLYRQINTVYKNDYDFFISSGLYSELEKENFIVSHEEADINYRKTDDAYKIIKPEFIDFISYPYEWSFSQLKDGALLTLEIQKRAYKKGMVLKDATAYNIQFHKGKPLFIDSLSFTKYNEGEPWIAYRQFCQHFLAPLLLMAYRDIRLNQLLKVHIDGIPLDLASVLLPFKTKLSFPVLSHIHFHAKSQKRYEDKQVSKDKLKPQISSMGFQGIIDSLETCIKGLKWKAAGTEWHDYYDKTNYSDLGAENKKVIVEKFIDIISPKNLWDLGGNVGAYSRIASDKGIKTICFDIDPACVELNYSKIREKNETAILPLLMDFTNPSPSMGWAGKERDSLEKRGPAHTAMALALIHHLAISNNVPLDYIAEFFAGICKNLIIEFVPKSDSQVQKLLTTREDIFPDYKEENFEKTFSPYFNIKEKEKISDTERTLYLMSSSRNATLR